MASRGSTVCEQPRLLEQMSDSCFSEHDSKHILELRGLQTPSGNIQVPYAEFRGAGFVLGFGSFTGARIDPASFSGRVAKDNMLLEMY